MLDSLVETVVVLELLEADLFAHANVLDDLLSKEELKQVSGLLTRGRRLRFGVRAWLQIATKPVDGLGCGETVVVRAEITPVAFERKIVVDVLDDIAKLETRKRVSEGPSKS